MSVNPFVETQTQTRTVDTDIGRVKIEFIARTRPIMTEALVVAMERYESLTGKDSGGYSIQVYQDECARRMLKSWSCMVEGVDVLKRFPPSVGWSLLDPETNVAEKLLTAMGIRKEPITPPDPEAKNTSPGEKVETLSSGSTTETG